MGRSEGSEINSEAYRLFEELFHYANEARTRDVYDFTEVVDGFHQKLASEYNPNSTRNSLRSRVLAMMKRYVETDPRIQLRMDQF